jgi:hypothetical protein
MSSPSCLDDVDVSKTSMLEVALVMFFIHMCDTRRYTLKIPCYLALPSGVMKRLGVIVMG